MKMNFLFSFWTYFLQWPLPEVQAMVMWPPCWRFTHSQPRCSEFWSVLLNYSEFGAKLRISESLRTLCQPKWGSRPSLPLDSQ